MFKHVRATGVLAGAAAVMLTASPSLARIDKCSKLIDGENLKIQSTFAKAFGKCNDFYRKEVAKGEKKGVPADLAKAGASCQKQLDKAFVKLDKETAKLASKVDGKTCIDADLLALGHVPSSVFGTRWAQTQGVGALQSAYEQQLQGTKDWINMLIDMADAGSCPTCAKLEAPPCSETACKLLSTNDSTSPSKASVDLAGSPTIVVPLAGSTVLKVCDVSSLISSAAGVLFVVGGPGKILDPAPVGAISTACTATIASEGLIQCGAGPQKVSYTQCVDHNAGAPNEAGATTAGDCTGNSCSASMTDIEDPNVINGGTCITLNSGAGTAGDAYINLVSRIALHAPGSDCLDDPTSPGTPQNTALTTGSAQATVKDADDNAGTEASSALISGSPFDCATLKRGDAGTVKLVGAFPAVNTLEPAPGVLLDSTTSFVLECE